MAESGETTIEVSVKALVLDERTHVPVVMLKEKDGERMLPIWIGPAEASAIAIALEDMEPQRPLTHDLLLSIIEGLRATVQKVVVTEIRDSTFYARIFIRGEGGIAAVDARPSDSVALALRAKAPIFVASAVFEQHGSTPEEPGPEDRAQALRDHLRNLDLKDFGKLEG
ncbi:bifunctional nuclease family protein [Candidatus Fermentibacteria bacterium]|nr:bifunctional nuclease family protein [Candidatus Fermentibacteria bacterium]